MKKKIFSSFSAMVASLGNFGKEEKPKEKEQETEPKAEAQAEEEETQEIETLLNFGTFFGSLAKQVAEQENTIRAIQEEKIAFEARLKALENAPADEPTKANARATASEKPKIDWTKAKF